MAEVKWIKITTSMFEDEKIDFIESLPEADTILIIWVKLLTLAGKCNSNGFIFLTEKIPYTEEMLAHKFRRSLNTVKLALERLAKLEMLEFDNNGFFKIANWEKHQNVEGLDKIREKTRLRVAKHREKQKLKELEEGKSSVTGNVTVTQGNATDIDIELDIELDKDIDIEEDIERDIDKNKINWSNILESWNSLPDSINKIRTISGTRRDKVKTRMKNLNLTEEDILKAIERIKESNFLQGKNDRSWAIKFDWLFKNDTNIMKLLEGNYDNKEIVKSKYEDGIKKDSFNSYEQRDYDFDDLEKKLLGWK
ncbi:hypothetical protein DP145_01590 [Clostridium tetani]|uniref:phage replisome organizer N-terminal domain-containing protein n=1 Tax=Clostridium tetani TaxID=1513 RepID=UPI00100A96F4|nr:phage replisome organizer N-terminal domain-containing protein [Clostridium tetani]RXI46059.1 hypothetical protein DP126_07670 [Clostridium tetani]RXM61451.1 hypothetical protein DP138_04505 [Clostridium tetani]RXM70276.1 hypothetical protein DP145_01590 [Clostridium tetani]